LAHYRHSRENGNPVFLNGSLLSQGRRLDSGFRRSDGFLSFYETIINDGLVKGPVCHPEPCPGLVSWVVSGSLKFLILLDAESILKQVQHKVQKHDIFPGF
jgi:hypothetical protein